MIFPPPLPLTLTDEQIKELLGMRDMPAVPPVPPAYSNYGWSTPKTYTRHEWKPILLLMSTVYNCKLCGAKKEDAKDAYCNEEPDSGGW